MNDRSRNRSTVLFPRPEELKGLIRMDEAIAAVEQGATGRLQHFLS